MGSIQVPRAKSAVWSTRAIGVIWRSFDLQLVTYALLLALVGLTMAYSNTVAGGGAVVAPGSTFVRGLTWLALAMVAFSVTTAFDYRWIRTFAWLLYLVQIGLLVLTLLIGTGLGGTVRWVQIGSVQLQFSEIAKVLQIAVVAAFLASRNDRPGGLGTILGACLLSAPPAILVLLQPDLGTSLVFAAVLLGMLFLSGVSLRWLGLLVGATVAALPVVWSKVLLDYQRERIMAFLDPNCDILDSCYQLHQSQIAVGAGGLFGKGLTNGAQNQLNFLPVQATDFVWAILSEELGFAGAVVVLLIFVALLWRILTAAWRSRDPFGTIFGAGFASMVLFQLVVNVGMVIGVMPITGIPLPFITHGGSSLISLALGLGIIQSVNMRQGRADW